jgi:hypothetical protein
MASNAAPASALVMIGGTCAAVGSTVAGGIQSPVGAAVGSASGAAIGAIGGTGKAGTSSDAKLIFDLSQLEPSNM